jgi:serine/threonine-protein kinase
MGIVYCARDKRLKREIAIKVLPPELSFRADIRQRFLREAETAAQLNHPNIVPIYTVEEKDNLVYFVMAYIKGDNLGVRLQQHGPMPPVEVRRILREVAEALAYAHNRNVIHRDIKPDNIIIDEETGRAMVTDFGIARALTDTGDSRLTATGMAIGTPAYMSPEQSAGDKAIDGRAISTRSASSATRCSRTPPFVAKYSVDAGQAFVRRPVPVDERWPDLPRISPVMCLKDPNDVSQRVGLAVALSGGSMPTWPPAHRRRPLSRRTPAATFTTSPAPGGNAHAHGAVLGSSAVYAQSGSPTNEEVSRWTAPPVVVGASLHLTSPWRTRFLFSTRLHRGHRDVVGVPGIQY